MRSELTLEEAAAMLGIAVTLVRQHIPVHAAGERRYVYLSDVLAYRDEQARIDAIMRELYDGLSALDETETSRPGSMRSCASCTMDSARWTSHRLRRRRRETSRSSACESPR